LVEEPEERRMARSTSTTFTGFICKITETNGYSEFNLFCLIGASNYQKKENKT
jgi:hypothetical protein